MNINTNNENYSKSISNKEKPEMKVYYHSTGSDKSAVARVFMSKGTGEFLINNTSLDQYFKRLIYREVVMLPLKVIDVVGRFNFKISVKGGGCSGQADAIKLGIAKALVEYEKTLSESDNSYKKALRAAGCITRDKRKVERKKYGFRKARKQEQFSKR